MTKKHIPETEQQPETPNAENSVTLSAELPSNKDEHNEVGDKGKQDSLTIQEETMKKQSEAGKADDQNTDKTDRTLTSAQIDLTKKANLEKDSLSLRRKLFATLPRKWLYNYRL